MNFGSELEVRWRGGNNMDIIGVYNLPLDEPSGSILAELHLVLRCFKQLSECSRLSKAHNARILGEVFSDVTA